MGYKKNTFLFSLMLICVIATGSGVSRAQTAISAKMITLDQFCELYLDYPMSADNLYQDKPVKTTVKVSSARRIPSICDNTPEGTFTMDVVSNSGQTLECVCNPAIYKSVPDNTLPGSILAVEGTFKSMTGSYTNSEQKQCKITLFNCSFK
jgi:hypothetical protein